MEIWQVAFPPPGSRVGGLLSRGQPVLADLPGGETIGQQRSECMSSSLYGKKAPPYVDRRKDLESILFFSLVSHLYLVQVTFFVCPDKFVNIRNCFQE